MRIEAALTGHLVLSTMHTNNAASTPISPRQKLGVEPLLVTARYDFAWSRSGSRAGCATTARSRTNRRRPSSSRPDGRPTSCRGTTGRH